MTCGVKGAMGESLAFWCLATRGHRWSGLLPGTQAWPYLPGSQPCQPGCPVSGPGLLSCVALGQECHLPGLRLLTETLKVDCKDL